MSSNVSSKDNNKSLFVNILIGGLSGSIASIFSTPFETLKTRGQFFQELNKSKGNYSILNDLNYPHIKIKIQNIKILVQE